MEVILYKLIQFFLVLSLGYGLTRGNIIQEHTLPVLSQLVTKVFLPAFTFYSLYNGNSRQQLIEGIPVLLITGLFYLVLTTLFAILAKVMNLQGERKWVFQALFIFGNTGFIGFPIIQSLNGGKGIIYMAMFSIVDQAILWSYGIWLCGNRGKTFRIQNLVNPCMIAIILAMAALLSGFSIPTILLDTVASVGNANTAVCMIYLGALLYYSDLRSVLKEKELYIGIAVKMLMIPICMSIILSLLPLDTIMQQTLIVLSALPTMTIVPILAKNGGNEGEYATGVTMVTLVVSLVTLPLVAWLVL